MISDAEKFKEEDERNRSVGCGYGKSRVHKCIAYKILFDRLRIHARNGLESYCLDLLGSVKHLSEKDGEIVSKEANEGLKWLESHIQADKKQIDERRGKIEKICGPIIQSLYSQSGTSRSDIQSSTNNRERAKEKGPTIEETD